MVKVSTETDVFKRTTLEVHFKTRFYGNISKKKSRLKSRPGFPLFT